VSQNKHYNKFVSTISPSDRFLGESDNVTFT